MIRGMFFATLLAAAPVLHGQGMQGVDAPAADAQKAASPVLLASVEPTASISGAATAASSDLPDAPEVSTSFALDQAGVAPSAGSAKSSLAPKYAGIILPGQTTIPLSPGAKVTYGFLDAFSAFNLVSITASAGFSHLIDSAPHYGHDGTAFAKREGAAALRSTVQALGTDAVFAPIFGDDPRYYELGRGNSFFKRGLYAASRVVVTRSDAGHHRPNVPLLLGYGAAAGVSNLIYPDQDTGAKNTLQNYGTSLVGAAVGMEVNEFLDDALRIVHIRK